MLKIVYRIRVSYQRLYPTSNYVLCIEYCYCFSRQVFITKRLGSRTAYSILEYSLSSGPQPASIFPQNHYFSILLFFKHFNYANQSVRFTLTLLPGHF